MKGQEVGIKSKHWLKLKDIELLWLHTMHTRNPNIKKHMLENIHEMVCESKIIYGIEVRGLSEAWKELYKVHRDFARN